MSRNLTLSQKQSLQCKFQFIWSKDWLDYLGIKLMLDLEQVIPENYEFLLQDLNQQIIKLKGVEVLWMEGMNLDKAYLVPKILYLFRMIPGLSHL